MYMPVAQVATVDKGLSLQRTTGVWRWKYI